MHTLTRKSPPWLILVLALAFAGEAVKAMGDASPITSARSGATSSFAALSQ